MESTAVDIFMQKSRVLDYMLRKITETMKELGALHREAKPLIKARPSILAKSGPLPEELGHIQSFFQDIVLKIKNFDGRTKPIQKIARKQSPIHAENLHRMGLSSESHFQRPNLNLSESSSNLNQAIFPEGPETPGKVQNRIDSQDSRELLKSLLPAKVNLC